MKLNHPPPCGDVEFIEKGDWPLPVLPMVRTVDHGWPEQAVLVKAADDTGWFLFLGNVFELQIMERPIETQPKLHYLTAEAIVLDGWRVD